MHSTSQSQTMYSRQSLLTDLSFATNLISNNMSMRVLGPNLEDFGPKLEENKPFEFLKKNVSFAFQRPREADLSSTLDKVSFPLKNKGCANVYSYFIT